MKTFSAKGGQSTIFMMIAILLVLIIILIFTINYEQPEEPVITQEIDVQPVKRFVESCIAKHPVEGLYQLGRQGGFIEVPTEHIALDFAKIPYYNADSLNLTLTREAISSQFENYLKGKLQLCLEGLSEFNKQGMSIEKGDMSVELEMHDDYVIIYMYYPLTLRKGDSEARVQDFKPIRYDVRLGHIIDIARNIMQREILEPETIDINYLTSIDVDVISVIYDSKTVIYFLKDGFSLMENKPYIFAFAKEWREESQ